MHRPGPGEGPDAGRPPDFRPPPWGDHPRSRWYLLAAILIVLVLLLLYAVLAPHP